MHIIQTNSHLSVYKDILEASHARLYVVARIWSQPIYPLMKEMDKENVWYDTMGSYVSIRHGKRDLHIATWMNLKVLSKKRITKRRDSNPDSNYVNQSVNRCIITLFFKDTHVSTNREDGLQRQSTVQRV